MTYRNDHYADTDYGFEWGPARITRIARWPDKGYTFGLDTDHRRLQIHVSEKGRSVRVWLDDEELRIEGSGQ